MLKNKKLRISGTAIIKKLVYHSFLVFLFLSLFSLAGAILMAIDLSIQGASEQAGVEPKGVFNSNHIKNYQELFSIIDQRRINNSVTDVVDYPNIFKQLTERLK